ncbi:MAG TPA: TauD/TfdA family dioxygenase [Streptosporangiaceae bacterium]|nr:TauD/TfdA family dioxygenase [Streptosporangiaceae bacterium]
MELVRDSLTPIGGGWLGADLAADPSRWRIELPPAVRDELMELAAKRAGRTAAFDDTAPSTSRATADFVSRLRDMFTSGCYFAVVSGFPYEPISTAQDAYWLLGLLLGDPISQSPQRTLIGNIEVHAPRDRDRREWEASNALPFHTDPADLVTMLCVRPAPSGGLSRLASARAVHDLLLAEAPHHLVELYRPFPQECRRQPERWSWTAVPVFGRAANGDFTVRHARWHVRAAQRHDEVPRLSENQIAALDALDEILERPGVSLDVDLRPGELELFYNAELLHARSAFADAPHGAGRLMLRLWLSIADSPELPDHYHRLFGATAAGSYRGGVWPSGPDPDQLGHPVIRGRPHTTVR